MKRILRVCSIVLCMLMFQFDIANAEKINVKKFNNINILIDEQVLIDTQINGVSQDYNKEKVQITNLSIEIEDNNTTKKYEDFKEKKYKGQAGVKLYYKKVDTFTENAIIKVKGIIKLKDLNINVAFTKKYCVKEIIKTIEGSSGNRECNINITSNDLKNMITYDVIFKTEDGGKFNEDLEYIEHVNIISGKEYPNVPELRANDNYNFLGWYDEETGLKINEFPSKVTKDSTVIAKWQKNDTIQTVATVTDENNNMITLDNSNLKTLDSYNPPKTAVENNMTLFIVSLIFSITVTLSLKNCWKGRGRKF